MKRLLLILTVTLTTFLSVYSQNYSWGESISNYTRYQVPGVMCTTNEGNVAISYPKADKNHMLIVTPDKDTIVDRVIADDCRIHAITPVSDGFYICGLIKTNAKFYGNGEVFQRTSTIVWQSFYAKYDMNGYCVMLKLFPSSNDSKSTNLYDIKVDGNGDVVVCGYLSGGLTLSPTVVLADQDRGRPFVAKFDSSGTYKWHKAFDNSGYFYTVAIDDSNSIYVGGKKNLVFSIVKYSSDGVLSWDKSATEGYGYCYELRVADNNRLLFFGEYKDRDLTFGGKTIEWKGHQSKENIVLGEIRTDGAAVNWFKAIHGGSYEELGDVQVDSKGNIIISGTFTSYYSMYKTDFDLGDGKVEFVTDGNSYNKNNAFLLKYSSTGEYLWVKNIGLSRDYEYGHALTLGKNDDIYMIMASNATSIYPNVNNNVTNFNDILRNQSASFNNKALYFVKYASKSSDAELKKFELSGQEYGFIKDSEVHIKVPFTTNITSIVPDIEISTGATISPDLATSVDLTNPRKYTVTAEDGVSKKEYMVYVRKGFDMSVVQADTLKFESDTIGFKNIDAGETYTFYEKAVEMTASSPYTNGSASFEVSQSDGEGSVNLFPAKCKFDFTSYDEKVLAIETKAFGNNTDVIFEAYNDGVKVSTVKFKEHDYYYFDNEFNGIDSLIVTSLEGYVRKMVIYREKPEAAIVDLTFDNQVGNSVIDVENKTVNAVIEYGKPLTSITPNITVTEETTISPDNIARDFTLSQKYTLTKAGEDSEWTVNIVNAKNSAAELISCIINTQIGETTRVADTLTILMPKDDDVNAKDLDAEVSDGAVYDVVVVEEQKSFVINVTSEDASAIKKYNVNIERAKSDKAILESIVFPNQNQSAEIDNVNKKVKVFLPYGYNIENAEPTISVSKDATYQYILVGEDRYVKITAENGTTKSDWLIEFVVDKNNATEVLDFIVQKTYQTTIIDEASASIHVYLNYGVDLSEITPQIEVSVGATYNYHIVGDTYVIDVTAENGVDERRWTIYYTVARNTEAIVKSYFVDGQVGSSVIDSDKKSITVNFPYGTDLNTSMAITIAVSGGATYTTANVTGEEFQSVVTVTSEDEVTINRWTVYYNVLKNDKAELLSFELTGIESDIDINTDTKTINVIVKSLTTLIGISPVIEVSPGATYEYKMSDGSVINENTDFTNSVKLLITSEDSNLTEEWTVEMSIFTSSKLNIETVIGIYPNPVTDILFIRHNNSFVDIILYDSNGRVVKQKKSAEGNESTLRVDDLTSGTYILKLVTKNGRISSKIIID